MTMLHTGPFVRKQMTKEVDILDGEMQSRYDEIHGHDGLCHALVELFDAMVEIRMKAEYGDYLAYTCAALRKESMSDLVWKIDKRDWQEVARQIEKEERTKAQQEARRLAISPTPYLDDLTKAATRLGYDYSLIRYQIRAYAERNEFCHSGIKGMIDHAEVQELAERIVEDKRALGVIFQGRPQLLTPVEWDTFAVIENVMVGPGRGVWIESITSRTDIDHTLSSAHFSQKRANHAPRHSPSRRINGRMFVKYIRRKTSCHFFACNLNADRHLPCCASFKGIQKCMSRKRQK